MRDVKELSLKLFKVLSCSSSLRIKNSEESNSVPALFSTLAAFVITLVK